MASEHFEVIADFFVKKPLYAKIEVRVDVTVAVNLFVVSILPSKLARECERCGQVQHWDRIEPSDRWGGGSQATMSRDTFASVVYRCRNCREAALRVWFFFTAKEVALGKAELSFIKVGHYPPLEMSPPANLRKALDKEHLDLVPPRQGASAPRVRNRSGGLRPASGWGFG